MNILFLANELRYTCGVTNHLIHLVEGLSKYNDINLFIICGGGNGTDRFEKFKVKITSDKRFLHKRRSIISYFYAVSFLKTFIKQNKIDIVHSHYHYGANIAYDACKKIKIKTIQTNHGILGNRGRLKHFIADKYIAINEHIYNYLIEKKIIKKENISFIRCGIPIPSEPAFKKTKHINVLAASRFAKEKGLSTFIKAVSKIKAKSREGIEFLIAGEGELENELLKLNDKLKAGIKFLGRVNDMANLLQSTRVFVYPSTSNAEGFPAVITEAGAYNNLLICSDFMGVTPMIQNEINGLIYHKGSSDELKDLLEKACNNYQQYNSISLNLYQKIKIEFDFQTMIDKHINLYKTCLQQ